MKKIILALPFFLLNISATSIPTTHPSPTSNQEGVPPKIAPEKPLEPVHTQPQPRPKIIIPHTDKLKPLPSQGESLAQELFYYPGVISSASGKWTGGDNFLNLSKSIYVQVNFIKVEGVEIAFTEEKFQMLISSIFEKNGLNPNGGSDPRVPLPFFNLIIMIFPTADGMAAAIQGRLFEQVLVSRVQLKSEVFQAITWEQTHLVFGPTEEFEKLLTTNIENIANTFVTRVNAHSESRFKK